MAGQCISASHVAESSARIQQTCMATGEAAGLAAVLSLEHGTTPRQLNPQVVVERLEAQRAAVEPAYEMIANLPIAAVVCNLIVVPEILHILVVGFPLVFSVSIPRPFDFGNRRHVNEVAGSHDRGSRDNQDENDPENQGQEEGDARPTSQGGYGQADHYKGGEVQHSGPDQQAETDPVFACEGYVESQDDQQTDGDSQEDGCGQTHPGPGRLGEQIAGTADGIGEHEFQGTSFALAIHGIVSEKYGQQRQDDLDNEREINHSENGKNRIIGIDAAA